MTTFQFPLKGYGAAGDTGNPQTETSGYVHVTKIVSLDGTATNSRKIVTLPDKATLTSLRACATSAFAADVSAVNVNFGNSAQATRYGVVAVSAVGQIRGAVVSAATDFDTTNTIVITTSAVSTAVFTTGGVRAFVEYIVSE